MAWQTFIGAGYDYNFYRRSVETNMLKSSEQTVNTSGFHIGLALRKNYFGIKTGIGYIQLSEFTNYVTENKEYSYQTTYKMVDPNFGRAPGGTKIVLIKTLVDTFVTSNFIIKHPNSMARFTYLKVPVLGTIQYSLHRIGIYAEAGLNLAVLLQSSGDYSFFRNNEMVLQPLDHSKDLNHMLYQSYTAGGVKINFLNNLNLYAGYGYMHSFSSMLKSYVQKPNISFIHAGIELGI